MKRMLEKHKINLLQENEISIIYGNQIYIQEFEKSDLRNSAVLLFSILKMNRNYEK